MPPGPQRNDPDAGTIGVMLFLAALAMLFVTSLVGYALIRSRAAAWPPPGMPPLPPTLWAATGLLLLASGTMHLAHRRSEKGDQPSARRWVRGTFLLGVMFLVGQCAGWFALSRGGLGPRTNLYGFTLYMLTGLHAAHVIGGLVPLVLILRRTSRGSADRRLFHAALYWHFLDGAWLLVFVPLLLGS